jgi:hypothetical protein
MPLPKDFQGDYLDLRKRAIRRLKAAQIQHQVFEIIEKTYGEALAEENCLLSRAERKRLLLQVTRSLLKDMLQKLESSSATAQ